ncbi:MAG: TIGR02186 family protein, partial [Alphaproteobacteria bacterium]
MARLALFAALLFWCVSPSRAQPVIADVSEHFVGITADFTGAKILFFGTTTGPGNIVVVIRG